MMKQIAIAAALALGTSMAFATDPAQKKSATDGAPKGNAATDYWKQHGKEGYMTKEQALGYKSADGKPMDWKRLDADADGRVSQTEWTGYHTSGARASDGSKDHGADDRSGGAAGPAAK